MLGVESFLSSPSISAQPTLTSTTPDIQPDGRNVIQGIVNRVLGLGVQTAPSESTPIYSILQQAASTSGRPIGIVVRQSSTPREMELLLNMMNRNGTRGHMSSGFNPRRGVGIGGGGGSLDDLMHYLLMNESSRPGAPPLAQTVMEKLPRRTENLEELGECSISQEPFVFGDVAVCLPCGHNFKEEAILPWLRMHDTCPVCRVSLGDQTPQTPR